MKHSSRTPGAEPHRSLEEAAATVSPVEPRRDDVRSPSTGHEDSRRPLGPAGGITPDRNGAARRRADSPIVRTRSQRAAVVGVLLALFLALYAFSNLTALGQGLENSWARQYDQTTPGLWLDDTHWFPPFHFDHATIVIGTLLAAAVAAVQRRWRTAVIVLVVTPIAIASSELFKDVAGRPRLVQSLDVDASYPSGHAGIALAVTAALLIAAPRRTLRWLAPLLVGWCALVVGGLQAEGQHRASEVIGSGLLVSALFLLASAVFVPTARVIPIRSVWSAPRRGLVLAVLLAVLLIGSWTPVAWMTLVYMVSTTISVGLVLLVALNRSTEAA